jgi:phosphohistidine phosphatase
LDTLSAGSSPFGLLLRASPSATERLSSAQQDFLRPLKLAVDAIWHSDKARAQQTGELLAGAVWARDRLVQHEGLGPKDQVAATKEALEQTGGDLMIVGHLPFLGKLVALLVTGSEKNEIVEFRFGGVVCVERRDDKKWKVAWMVTPSLFHGQN